MKAIEKAGDKIKKAGYDVGYRDIDKKTGKLTRSGQSKISNPLKHHEDFDNSDGFNNHYRTSFRGGNNEIDLEIGNELADNNLTDNDSVFHAQ